MTTLLRHIGAGSCSKFDYEPGNEGQEIGANWKVEDVAKHKRIQPSSVFILIAVTT
jgi:hypothetical protein